MAQTSKTETPPAKGPLGTPIPAPVVKPSETKKPKGK